MAKKKSNSAQSTFDSIGSKPSMPDGYYSGDQPNPNLRRFVEEHSTVYDPVTDQYNVPAFNQPITTTKATAIYNMHSYHQGKKPHDAIRQYIRHYTRPGDIILDPFSGSGGTSLAALMEGRKPIAIDRSPAATFITKNYCTPVDLHEMERCFNQIKHNVQSELERLYETSCDRCGGKAMTAFTVFSQVFQCPRCLQKVPLFDCVEGEGTTGAGKPKKITVCPACHKKGHEEEISTRSERFGAIPVLVNYLCKNGCSPARAERRHNDADAKKRQFFEKYDLAKIREIDSKPIPHWYPPHRMMNVEDDTTPWGAKWRAGTSNFRTVADLYTKRNLWAIAAWMNAAGEAKDDRAKFAIGSLLLGLSKMCRYDERWSFPFPLVSGTYYMPQISKEMNAFIGVVSKVENTLTRGWKEIAESFASVNETTHVVISTQSSTRLASLPANSVDYIFTDPPYSDNVQYGELNFIWEAWQGFDTHWHDEEIIVNDVRGKSEADWALMMQKAMAECYRVLKPGRWLSLCYHDTSEGTWELVQDIMAEVGFIVDKTEFALFIDSGQNSFNQLTADKATKRDLVLNFRKPKPLPFKVTKVYGPEDAEKLPKGSDIATFTDFARQIVRDFLTRHPGATKDRIYDELVSRMVMSRSMEAHDFDALLRTVAEEVQQQGQQGRWYLKETADQVDQAEQAKEAAVAARQSKFIGEHVKNNPELEGVHYSELFEQYLSLHDKPRRLLSDWLPEYFIKTPSGTWRLPDKEESQQLAELREAGTLRRIKRFANALIDGVPIPDKARPGNDVDLLDWLRQCRRAGLYEQGRAIYEKGGLNSANLNDEQQIEAEDDYRICVRRRSENEAKPKKKRRKMTEDDE